MCVDVCTAGHHEASRKRDGWQSAALCYQSRAMFRATLLILLLSLAAGAREFDPRRDAFAFSNDTALDYSVDGSGRLVV